MSLHETLQTNKLAPGFRFTTEPSAPHGQFDACCKFTSSMCDLEAIVSPKASVVASADSYRLGSLQLTSVNPSPMRFTYTQDIIRKASFDHCCVSVTSTGTVDKSVHTAASATVIHSCAAPCEGRMDATNASGLFSGRDEFRGAADQRDTTAHQQVEEPMSHIVGDFLASLEHRAEKLTASEASAVKEAFGHLIRAMVRHTPETAEAAKAPIAAAQFDRARRFINANLKSPNLTPEWICLSIGVSRRQLYYLFEQHGGVATFIRSQRLGACYTALTKTSEKKLISQTAYENGFTNLSSFYRQFKARYGLAPSEVRTAWLAGDGDAQADGGTFVDWLLRTEED